MFHILKITAAVTACLFAVTACSSDATTQLDAASAEVDASSQVADSAELKASPVDLDLVALLATQTENTGTTVAQSLPAGSAATNWKIIPAKSVTYQRSAPIELDTDAEYGDNLLPLIAEDSDLLEGTVYESEAARTKRKPMMAPGTYRTIEYKK